VDVIDEQDQVQTLFAALAANQVDEFLAGCSEQLLITLWGSGALSTTISPPQLPLWWESFQGLAEGTLVTEVMLTLPDERSHMVILRHAFTRQARVRRFDTVNFCTFRDGALAAWFSKPLDREEYIQAWGLQGSEGVSGGTVTSPRLERPPTFNHLERR
jgi:hypothetical protein